MDGLKIVYYLNSLRIVYNQHPALYLSLTKDSLLFVSNSSDAISGREVFGWFSIETEPADFLNSHSTVLLQSKASLKLKL